MHPSALIPATTALATLIPDGRERGILAGANVVMPNLSPREERRKYELYNDKASLGAESAEGLIALQKAAECHRLRDFYRKRRLLSTPQTAQIHKDLFRIKS